jgi:rubrerythrin
MDITKFNKNLAEKVAKANAYEKNNRIQDAIDTWVEISEMALNASKTPNLDFSYRSMIIKKAQQIIEHIKELKAKIKKSIEPSTSLIDDAFDEELFQESDSSEEIIYEEMEQKSPKAASISKEINNNDIPKKDNEIKFVEDNDFKNLPKGFKEIEASEDFEIVTPHDKDYVEKIIKQDINMSIFKHDKQNSQPQQHIELEQPKDDKKIVCFACGTISPSNTKICPNCGTELK